MGVDEDGKLRNKQKTAEESSIFTYKLPVSEKEDMKGECAL